MSNIKDFSNEICSEISSLYNELSSYHVEYEYNGKQIFYLFDDLNSYLVNLEDKKIIIENSNNMNQLGKIINDIIFGLHQIEKLIISKIKFIAKTMYSGKFDEKFNDLEEEIKQNIDICCENIHQFYENVRYK